MRHHQKTPTRMTIIKKTDKEVGKLELRPCRSEGKMVQLFKNRLAVS